MRDVWAPLGRFRAVTGLAQGFADGPLLAEGEARAEAPSATRIAASVPLAIAEDEETSRQIAAGWLLAYLTRMGPLYPRMLSERFGFAHEVEALPAANANGGPPRLPAAAERLARDVIVMGTYDEAPAAERLWLEAGADRACSVFRRPSTSSPTMRWL